MALRRFRLALPLQSNAPNFICDVLSLPLDRRLPKSSEEGRCPLFALNVINFNLFFATCYQQHLGDGLGTTKEAFRGRKVVTQFQSQGCIFLLNPPRYLWTFLFFLVLFSFSSITHIVPEFKNMECFTVDFFWCVLSV